MEGIRKTEHSTVIMFRPQPSDGLKDQHSQTDSFLTAARLIRNGWNNEEKNEGRQFHITDRSVNQPAVSKSSPIPAEIILKASSIRLVANSRKTEKDKEVIPQQPTKKIKQTCKKEFSAKRGEIQTGQAGIAYFQVSGCRAACRQSRRFKAPLLPVISEM